MSKTKKKPETITDAGPIARGSVPFITVKEVGEIGSNGRKVLGIGYIGRMKANPEYPFSSLVMRVMEMLTPMVHYRTQEEFDKDLSLLKSYIGRLVCSAPSTTQEAAQPRET